MSDFDDQILELSQRTKQNRREFLITELQTCSIAIERARLELSMGNSDEAKKELAFAVRGAQVIQRFLGEAPGEMTEIEAKVPDLRASIEALRLDIEKTTG